MLCDLGELLPDLTGLISIVGVVSVASMSDAVVTVSGAVVFEMGSVECWRVSVGGFEVAHEMTFVVQSNLVCDLLHTQETRLQQILGSLHAQQTQVAKWRHADIGFKNVTKSPNRKVY